MSIYIWTTHRASNTGTRLVEVRCEKCDGTYFYELTREGSGTECSAYFLFEDWARDTAATKAKSDAERRLASEAELVPCPHCNWINEELIEGYRRSCYRGWIEQSIWAAIIVIGFCVLLLSCSVGIPGHSNDVVFFGFFMPLLSILAVTSVVVFVRTMRKRIKPNSRYPEAPSLGKRVPPSYVLDGKSRQLVRSSSAALADRTC